MNRPLPTYRPTDRVDSSTPWPPQTSLSRCRHFAPLGGGW